MFKVLYSVKIFIQLTMSKANFVIGLDIGTSSLKGICAVRRAETEQYEVFAKAEIPSFGVRRGVVKNPDKVTEKIKMLVQELAHATNSGVDGVVTNINGSRIFSQRSKGNVVITGANELIAEEDITRSLEAARTISLTNNMEVLETFTNDFLVDNEKDIKDPLGMKGTRLEADVTAVCVFTPYSKALATAVTEADLDLYDTIASPVAASDSVLTLEQKELGVVLVDIGAGTTGMSVFEEGKLVHVAVFPIGSSDITNDIAYGLRIPVDEAERVKKRFLFKKKVAKKKKNKKGEDSEITIDEIDRILSSASNYKLLEKIISFRVKEILQLVKTELKNIGKSASLPGGAILVGGGAKMDGIVEIATKILGLHTQIGQPRGFLNIEPDPALAVLCGLILEREGNEPDGGSVSLSGISKGVSKFFKFFMP